MVNFVLRILPVYVKLATPTLIVLSKKQVTHEVFDTDAYDAGINISRGRRQNGGLQVGPLKKHVGLLLQRSIHAAGIDFGGAAAAATPAPTGETPSPRPVA